MEEFDDFMPKVHFEQIPIKNLVSNQEYQRELSEQHVKRAVENFDPYQINPVKVSRRDGINYVFNGQHTIEIIATIEENIPNNIFVSLLLSISNDIIIITREIRKDNTATNPYNTLKYQATGVNVGSIYCKGI